MLPGLQPPSRPLLCFPEDQELAWGLGAMPEPSQPSQSKLLCVSGKGSVVPSSPCSAGQHRVPAGHMAWEADAGPRFPSPVGMRVAGKAQTWFLPPPVQAHHVCRPGKHSPFIKAAEFGCEERTQPISERIPALGCAKAQADLCLLFPSRISFLRAGSSCSCSIPRESASCIPSG